MDQTRENWGNTEHGRALSETIERIPNDREAIRNSAEQMGRSLGTKVRQVGGQPSEVVDAFKTGLSGDREPVGSSR